jgi:hypothetical protein
MLKQPLPVVQASSDQADIDEAVLVTAWVGSEQADVAQVALGYALDLKCNLHSLQVSSGDNG